MINKNDLTKILEIYNVKSMYIPLIIKSSMRVQQSKTKSEENINRGKHIKLYKRAFKYTN